MVIQRLLDRLTNSTKLHTKDRAPKRRKRRQVQLEKMEKRELLANDLAAISGVTFDDLNNNGAQDVGEPLLTNVDVFLHRDFNGNGSYDDGVDQLVGSDTDGNGSFRFAGLDGPDSDGGANPDGVGRYFIIQEAAPGRTAPEPLIVDIADDSGARQLLIDDYDAVDANGQDISVSGAAGSSTSESSVIATGVVGGERDIQVTIASTDDIGKSAQLRVSDITGRLALETPLGVVATALVQYDGTDSDGAGLTRQATGLGSQDLSAGDALAGIELLILSDFQVDDALQIRIFTDANNFSVADLDLPGGSVDTELFVPFAQFAQGPGAAGPADFTDVGAIEAFVDPTVVVAPPDGLDFEITVLESRISNETTANVANVIPLSLGGTLFFDHSDAGPNNGQNNGVREGTEAAVPNGVLVELYELQNENDTLDLSTNPVAIASQATAGTGSYLFTGLAPGHYAVVVNAAQMNGPILGGYANSTGNDPAPDPDDNVDDDDNGLVFVDGNSANDGAVFTRTITLESNNEPDDDDDNDVNTNTTLDIGFFPQIDLGITKTLDEANSTLSPGGNVVFDFTVQNNGPLDATEVVVTDVFPAGLTPTGIQNASGNFTLTANGQTVTVDIGNIPNTGAVTFELTADIGANQFADVTNPASVAGREVDIDDTNDNDSADVDLPQADLSIVKTDLQDPVNAGEQFSYQITVTNNGPDDAAGVQVTDSLPAEVTFVSGDVGGNGNLVNVDQQSGDIIADIGPLANQATAVVTILVTVDEDAPTPLTNNATVTSTPNTDPNPNNNSTNEDTTINRSVDVEIDKQVTGSVIAGEVATYTVIVTNNGPSEARGIEVTDTLDDDLTLVANSFDAGTSGTTIATAGQDLTFTVGTLAAAATATFTFDVTIDSGATGTIPNRVDVTTTDTDSDPSNNNDTVNIAVDQNIDLILTKTVDNATAVPGQDQLVYTFTVSHDTDSPSDATNVVVSDTLPAGVSGVVIDAPNADDTDFTNGVVTVTFNSLPVGQTRTFTVTVDVDEDATGTIVNPASVAADETELDNTNNSDDATTTLNPDFDVVVTKSVSDATPDPGQTITYTVGVENEGPSTAAGVILTDPIPAGLTFVSATMEGQAGSSNGTTVTFPSIDIDSGQTATATLTFTVDTTSTGTITNTASVPDLSNAGENDATNNSASVDLTVTDRVDIRVAKTVSATDAQAGDTLTYTITVTNDGPSVAETVTATDTLPAGVTFVSGTGPNNEALAVNNGVVTVNGGDVANGGSFNFTIIATINAGAGTPQTNSVTVSTTTSETNLGNNTATVVTNVDPMTASIAGSVYVDANNNGVREAGEDGIENVAITLTGTDAQGNNVNLNTTTDANGDYIFANLAAGTYTVQETQPAGFIDGIDTRGTGAGATAGDDVFTQLGLGAAAAAADFDFGERLTTDPFSKRRFLASS